jgi:hypothetical protein
MLLQKKITDITCFSVQISGEGMAAMARSGSVAVILPTTAYILRWQHLEFVIIQWNCWQSLFNSTSWAVAASFFLQGQDPE